MGKLKLRPRELILGAVIAGLIALVLVVFIRGYWVDWAWTGFGGRPVDEKYQEPRSLWDWLGLLIVPLVLAAGGILFSNAERRNDREIASRRAEEDRKRADERAQVDRELAADGLRQAALQDYLDRMSELLLKEGLGGPQPSEAVRNVARAHTLTVLNRLKSDGERKASVIQFLYEASLIRMPAPTVDLKNANLVQAKMWSANLHGAALAHVDLRRSTISHADLRRTDFRGAHLGAVDLSKADLRKADLRKAKLLLTNLYEASLSGADLREAILRGADLREANLANATVTHAQLASAWSLRGAILPNGDKHPEDIDNIFRGQKQP
jgi:uncharacterized protein YjbI with pentapeptide repeats